MPSAISHAAVAAAAGIAFAPQGVPARFEKRAFVGVASGIHYHSGVDHHT
jgi:hypothetical protein